MQRCVLMVGQPGSHSCHRLPHAGTGLNHAVTATLRGCAATPMPLVTSTLPWPRRPGLIQKGLAEGEGKGRRRTDRRAPKSTEGAVVRRGMWCSSAKRTNVNHSQFLQHKAGPGDAAVPSIVYATAVEFDARLPLCLTHEGIRGKKKKTHATHTHPKPKLCFAIQPAFNKDAIFNKIS